MLFSYHGQRRLWFQVCITCGEQFINSCPSIATCYEINRHIVYVMRLIGLHRCESVFDIVPFKAVREEKLLSAHLGEPEDVLTVFGDDSWQKR